MYIGTWNLNNRAGKHWFCPEAAGVAIALDVDVLVFTEFFPKPKEDEGPFRATLKNAGWTEQLSTQPSEVANRVLIVSKLPLVPMPLKMPTFDGTFPANLLGIRLVSIGLSVVGLRIPAYSGKTAHLLLPAWEWLEATTASLRNSPSVIIGDLNLETSAMASRGGDHFRRILANGWHRATPNRPTFFIGDRGVSEIDHILATSHCIITDAKCFQDSAISDHAALVCQIEVRNV
jgi:hypothetical protein